jgi:hypothetical protein
MGPQASPKRAHLPPTAVSTRASNVVILLVIIIITTTAAATAATTGTLPVQEWMQTGHSHQDDETCGRGPWRYSPLPLFRLLLEAVERGDPSAHEDRG